MTLKKHFLVSVALGAAALTGAYAQQPYSACWFPDDIINWSPETDPDAKFNRSRIPLASRFTEPTLMKAHSGQSYTGYVETATITNKMCSLTPSQGDNNFLGYQPTYWQYIEKFVNWGGAGNEGIFVLPPAGTIDAAHMNGVKILGQLFFMPRTIGGRDAWIEAMLTKDASGKYPYAVKMYEIAKYFGFDGWFINKELDNGKRVSEWAKFITCFNETADAAGDTYMEIQWYDAKGKPTIEILESHKNTSQFLEYNNTGDKSQYASQLGCSADDILHRLYAGIECVQSGLTGYGSALSSVHKGSIALFCPEQNTYKILTDKMWEAGTTTGTPAYEAQQQTFANENTTWVNSTGNPANTSGTWKGVSGYVLERSVINAMPFTTSFSVGNGKHRFVKGQKLNTADWYATSVQSILPTWRYWIENQGNLKVSIDWDDAYNFGNAIKVSGSISAGDHLWRLYKTMIPVSGGTLRLVYKGNAPEVLLSTSSSTTADVTLSGAKTSTSNGWNVAEYDLSSVKGKTVYMIALNLKAQTAGSYELKLGELAMLPASYAPKAITVDDFACEGDLNSTSGDLRITWSYNYTNDFDHFDIYLTNANGRKLVGQTRGEGFYIPRFNREGSEKSVKVELAAVMKDGSSSTLKSIDKNFHAAAAPVITITPVKSYAAVGEKITLTASGTDNPTSFAWKLPASVKLVEGELSDATIVVEATEEGNPEISVEVANAQGSSTFKGVAFNVFSEIAYKEVHNVAIGKAIASCSRAVTGDAKYLIDGTVKPSTKDECWSDISTNPFVTVDLKTPHTIYAFNITDNRANYKSGEANIENYRILVSDDAKSWTEVVDARGVGNENVHTAYIAPVSARYVKLQPYADKRFTCRLFEFEIIGRDNSRITVDATHSIYLGAESSTTVDVVYNMNGEQRAENFGLALEASNSYVTFSDPVDDGKGTISFKVNGNNKIGKSEINVALINGESKRQTFIDVIVDNNRTRNCLAGTTAEMRKYDADYVTGAAFTSQTTGNLTDGNVSDEGLTEEMYEDPCTSRNDLWAVFKNTQMFNIGKVKVYLPNANKGINANDKEGFVNNGVSIRVSADGQNWDIVEEFKNLGEVSELTCFMPEMAPFTYLAVVCDVNTYFYPSMAEVEAFEQIKTAGPSIQPIAIAEGFNNDIIAEASPVEDHASSDFNYASFFTSAVQAEGAIASADSHRILTQNGTTFELGDYTKDNALFIDSKNEDFVLKFAQPVKTDKIYVLANATRYRKIYAYLTYADDSRTPEEDEIEIDLPRADYDSDNISEFAVTGLKIASNSGVERDNYGLCEVEIPADPTKEVVSIAFYATGRPEFWVYAVSALVEEPVSSIILTPAAADMRIAPETSSEIVVKYDMNGENRADNFACNVIANGHSISLGTPVENKSASTFTIPVKSSTTIGSTEVIIELTNGEAAAATFVTAHVEENSEFTGWNSDVIAENTPAADHVSAPISSEGWALYTSGIKQRGAIADENRTITTALGTEFRLEPFYAPNALKVDSDIAAELTAAETEDCTEIHILAFATGADAKVDVTFGYSDGSNSEASEISISDIAKTAADAAVTGLDFINASTDKADTFRNNFSGSLTECVVPTGDKTVKSVSFKANGKATAYILGLCRKSVDGIENVQSSPAERTIEAIYNMQGLQVKNPSAGLYIIRYSDGTSSKVYIR